MNFIEELQWRGLIHESTPGIEAFMLENTTAGYLGVDPTSDSMHIGNLVPVMMLVHLQRAGHTPIALVGGATGRVGDPSGKDKERQLLSHEQIEENVAGIRAQLAHFLDFESKENPAQMVNNYDWFKDISFLDFLRDVGKHLTINYMMAKESVKKRISGDTGISYTEFAYQLLQGYDFLHLYEHNGARLQVGGSDQWGNITTGTELIRRKLGSEAKAYAVVCPLMTREDGSKFGKTAGGQSVWLSAERTSPYEFYQYWIRVGDSDAERYIKIFTLKEREEIEALIAEHNEDKDQRKLQKALAVDITKRVHGEEGLASALRLTDFLFNQRNTRPEALEAFSEKDWEGVIKGADSKQLEATKLSEGMNILDLLVELGIISSKGEGRRAIEKEKAVKINAVASSGIDQIVSKNDAYYGRFMQINRSKKQRFIIELI